MEIDFPQGDLDYTMSRELKIEFYQKMKRVVWRLKVSKTNGEFSSTAFCVDSTGILLCAHHSVTEGEESRSVLCVEAEQGDKKVKCEVVFLYKHFDTAVLRIVRGEDDDDDLECFDYVSVVDDYYSRNISVGTEVFSIGLGCCSERIQFSRGYMTYGFQRDVIDYSSLLDNERCINRIEESGLYKTTSCRTVNQVFPGEDVLHPRLNIIEVYYPGVSSGGESGSPCFNSKGRLLGIHIRHSNGVVYGLPSPALKVVIDHYTRIGSKDQTHQAHHDWKEKADRAREGETADRAREGETIIC